MVRGHSPGRHGRGIHTWEREKGEGGKARMRVHLPSYPSSTLNSCCSSPALLCELPRNLEGRRGGSHLGLSPGAQLRCEPHPGAGIWGQVFLRRALPIHPDVQSCSSCVGWRVPAVPTSNSEFYPWRGSRIKHCWRGCVSPAPRSPSALGGLPKPRDPKFPLPGAFRTPQPRLIPPSDISSARGTATPSPAISPGLITPARAN